MMLKHKKPLIVCFAQKYFFNSIQPLKLCVNKKNIGKLLTIEKKYNNLIDCRQQDFIVFIYFANKR